MIKAVYKKSHYIAQWIFCNKKQALQTDQQPAKRHCIPKVKLFYSTYAMSFLARSTADAASAE